MTELYGHMWTSTYGVQDSGVWLRELENIPVQYVKHALEKCPETCPDWPPTLAKFMSLCKPDPKAPEHQIFIPELPGPQASPEKVRSHLENMRRSLSV